MLHYLGVNLARDDSFLSLCLSQHVVYRLGSSSNRRHSGPRRREVKFALKMNIASCLPKHIEMRKINRWFMSLNLAKRTDHDVGFRNNFHLAVAPKIENIQISPPTDQPTGAANTHKLNYLSHRQRSPKSARDAVDGAVLHTTLFRLLLAWVQSSERAHLLRDALTIADPDRRSRTEQLSGGHRGIDGILPPAARPAQHRSLSSIPSSVCHGFKFNLIR